MRFEIKIYAARVGIERAAIGRRQILLGLFGDVSQAQAPRFTIGVERGFPHHFGQFTRGQAPESVHLPHAILRGDEALQEQRVFNGRGLNVRNAQSVTRNGGRRGDGRDEVAARLGQRAPRIPVRRRRERDEQNRYAQIDRPERGRRKQHRPRL